MHVVALKSPKYTKNPSHILTLWEYLVIECKVDMSIGDQNDNRIASCYLPREIRKQLVEKDIPCQLPEVSKPKTSTEMATISVQIALCSITHEVISQENTAPATKAGIHQQPKISNVANISHKKEARDIEKSELDSPKATPKPTPSVSEAEHSTNSTPAKRPDKPKDYYTEEKVGRMFKRLLTLKLDSYFFSREPESEAMDQDKAAATVSKVVEKQKIERQHLPFKPEQTKWEVEVSERFSKQLNSECVSQNSVLTTIQKLAEGRFDRDSRNKLHFDGGPDLFEARVNDSVRLLYTILDRFSERDTEIVRKELKKQMYVYRKTIMVLDLVTKHKNINHDAKRALKTFKDQSYKKLGEEYLNRECLIPQFSLHCESHKITDEEKEHIKHLLNMNTNPQEGRKIEHIGTKMYSLTIQFALRLLDEKSKKTDFPIKVTDDEFDIIEKSSKQPVVVLGRSGTGKTTVCLCRLWKRFMKYWKFEDRYDNPLIPKNHDLRFEDMREGSYEVLENDEHSACQDASECSDEAKYLCSKNDTEKTIGDEHEQTHVDVTPNKCSVDSGGSDSDTTTEETSPAVAGIFKSEQTNQEQKEATTNECSETEADGSPAQQWEYEHIHQIFITKSGKLCEQMKQRFYEFIAGYRYAQKHKEFYENMKVQPQSLLEIDELCYPLFLTARQFFWLLDNSLGDGQEYFQDNEVAVSSEQPGSSKLETLHEVWRKEEANDDPKQLRTVEVTASHFQRVIWPRIQKRSKGSKIDPLLVWMEIQSFIKGSLNALESEGGALSLKDYEEFGRKRAPNFPMDRAKVYNLYKEYVKELKHKCIDQRLFDNGDFIYNLYKRLKANPYQQNWSIHYVYVDEVQDFTQAELAVIVRCCKHPNGFFFAGDTAQTIIKGIAFRFEDLTSIFYSYMEELNQNHWYR